jgi:NAD(P)-dependent dehydrogenase (short-subunit alcohol dehydrogenase family)
MRGLANKGVLITGGSSGLGRAAAQRFLEEGARVYICGHEAAGVEEAIAALAALGAAGGMVADVSRADEVERLVAAAEAWLGGIDILCNNAGIAWEEPFLEITPEHWDHILEVNLRGMFLVGQAVARWMAQRRAGVIVNMASKNGVAGEVKYAHYNASKGGVVMLTKTMALELGPLGIRVNALCPGYIVTPMSQAIDPPGFAEAYAEKYIPLRRPGRMEEVAAAYAFLASDEASFMHGACLLVDGGQLAE